MKTFSLYQLFVWSLFFVNFFLSNQALGEKVHALPKWGLVNQTFINAVSQQNHFNISNPLDRGTTSIGKVAPIRSPLSTLNVQKRLKTPVLLPRLRPSATEFSSDAANPIIPENPTEKAKNTKKNSPGIWRLEIGNEDRGVFVDVWEPIFDPIFGGSPTDGGMSWGFHLSYTPQADNPAWVNQLRPYIPWVERNAIAKTSFSLEQSANMHSHLTRKNRRYSEHLWTREQRPDVGYLAGSTRIGLQQILGARSEKIDMIDVSVGIIGPYSGAQVFHQLVHDITGGSTDKWHQVNSEPFVNINYQMGRRYFVWEPKGRETLEIYPYSAFALGNVMTHGKLGMSLRVGRYLEDDLGPPMFSQMLSGTNFPNITGHKFSWNVFVGVEGRAHAYSALLDENLISGGQSVDSHPYTYDAQAGFEIGYGNYRLTAMNVYRSREFKGQQHSSEFVRVALAAAF